jgi:hypothetical protein
MTEEETCRQAIAITVRMRLDRLDDEALAALNNCVYQGHDGRENLAYEKVPELFTEADAKGRRFVGPEVKAAIHAAARARFG